MMSHFNFKSLLFYGVAIGSVLLLFKVVTAYGEANLKAPKPIDGDYRLSLAQKPNCPKSEDLVLTIQQSGIYLNGFLLPARTNAQMAAATEEKPSLSGILRNQQLSLSGTLASSIFCSKPVSESGNVVTIQSQLLGENLEGKLSLSGSEIKFTAQKLAPTPPAQTSK
jgi:hypothetical protein